MAQNGRTGKAADEGRGRASEQTGWVRRHPIWTTVILLAVVLLVVPLTVAVVTYNRTEIPEPGSVRTEQISEIYQSDGTTMIGRIVPPEGNRTLIELDVVPVHVRNAVIAAEDRSFYTLSLIHI